MHKIGNIPKVTVIDKTITNNRTEFVTNEKITALVEAAKLLEKSHYNLSDAHHKCSAVEYQSVYDFNQEVIQVSKKRREIVNKLKQLSEENLYSLKD